jgi:hypothetical protein
LGVVVKGSLIIYPISKYLIRVNECLLVSAMLGNEGGVDSSYEGLIPCAILTHALGLGLYLLILSEEYILFLELPL